MSVLIVTKLLYIAVNDFDAKKSAGFSQVLVVSKTQRNADSTLYTCDKALLKTVSAPGFGFNNIKSKAKVKSENENDFPSRWAPRESNLMFKLSSNKDQSKNQFSIRSNITVFSHSSLG